MIYFFEQELYCTFGYFMFVVKSNIASTYDLAYLYTATGLVIGFAKDLKQSFKK